MLSAKRHLVKMYNYSFFEENRVIKLISKRKNGYKNQKLLVLLAIHGKVTTKFNKTE